MGQETVMSFIDRVKANKAKEDSMKALRNSDFYKNKVLDKSKEDCKSHCVRELFKKSYKDALPLSDTYKCANDNELDSDMDQFLTTQFPDGIEKVIAERGKRGDSLCKRITEGVEEIASKDYLNKLSKMDKCDADELAFKASDETATKIDLLSKDLELDDLSGIIENHVKDTIQSEVSRSLNEKRTMKEIESELADNMNVTTEESVQMELRKRGIGNKVFYQPSLFQGIMMGKLNESKIVIESGDGEVSLYNATEPLGREISENYGVEDRAFVESVKEYTKLSLMKACKLQQYNAYELKRIANQYASN